MRRFFFILISAAVLSVGVLSNSWAADQAGQEPFKSTCSLTGSLSGLGVIAPEEIDPAPSVGMGAHAFFDWRPKRLFSIGTGLNYFRFNGVGSPWTASWELGGRIFPFAPKHNREWYLAGGFGLMPPGNEVDDYKKRVHASAGVGCRMSQGSKRFLDLGLVYNAFSPRDSVLSALGVKVGMGFKFNAPCLGAACANKKTANVQAAAKTDARVDAAAVKTPVPVKIDSKVQKEVGAQTADLSKIADTRQEGRDVVVNLAGDLLFRTGGDQLTEAAKARLAAIGVVLSKDKKSAIKVTGHTDSTGNELKNIKLSEARAASVKAVLVANGVSAVQVATLGKGSSAPVAPNDTPAGRAANRRAEIRVSH
jgi:outer membrane protein OmpA-like peptidoglycan-associated protein